MVAVVAAFPFRHAAHDPDVELRDVAGDEVAVCGHLRHHLLDGAAQAREVAAQSGLFAQALAEQLQSVLLAAEHFALLQFRVVG